MRALCRSAVLAALLLSAPSSRAEKPDPGAGVVAGAVTFVTGFTVGGLVLAAADGSNAQSRAGWLVVESGFVAAPLAAHAVEGEWTRGLAFAAPPLVAVGGTAALFQYDPGTILHGSLPEQRWMWSMFCVGLLSGVAGVVDVAFARQRGAVTVTPTVGSGRVGLQLGGTL